MNRTRWLVIVVGAVPAWLGGCHGGNATAESGDAQGGPGFQYTDRSTRMQVQAAVLPVSNPYNFAVHVYIDEQYAGYVYPGDTRSFSVVKGSHGVRLVAPNGAQLSNGRQVAE